MLVLSPYIRACARTRQTDRQTDNPTPVLLPGKSHGWRRLVGCSPWGRPPPVTSFRYLKSRGSRKDKFNLPPPYLISSGSCFLSLVGVEGAEMMMRMGVNNNSAGFLFCFFLLAEQFALLRYACAFPVYTGVCAHTTDRQTDRHTHTHADVCFRPGMYVRLSSFLLELCKASR